ncbi:MAG TPA: DUF1614 domain-containing protein [Caulobacteraceae bacterium]|nr:DUF1614 domain-containing protein [Caulobacteraceae bacterium]
MGQLHYLPVGLPLFLTLAGALLLLVVLVPFGVLRNAYASLGVSSTTVLFVLLASLVGGYFNIPVAHLPQRRMASAGEVRAFGEVYVVPLVVNWPGTIVAVNVGGALIPGAASLYLLFKHALWARGAIAVALVAGVCHALARPVPGLGIALPDFVPGLAAAAAALALSPRRAAPLAYVGGSLGVLVGADLLNLAKLQGLGAPVASIGGAGAFDGIFLTGIVAVVIASLPWSGRAGI